jgi:hypothetical protein
MGEQPQPERKIELCTPNIVDLPITNLQDAGRPFKIKELYSPTKTQSLRNNIDTFVQLPMETTAESLERFNEYMRVEFHDWHIGFLMRRMEKMEREAQYLKAAKARYMRGECEEYDHVQGKTRFKIWFLFVHN